MQALLKAGFFKTAPRFSEIFAALFSHPPEPGGQHDGRVGLAGEVFEADVDVVDIPQRILKGFQPFCEAGNRPAQGVAEQFGHIAAPAAGDAQRVHFVRVVSRRNIRPFFNTIQRLSNRGGPQHRQTGAGVSALAWARREPVTTMSGELLDS